MTINEITNQLGLIINPKKYLENYKELINNILLLKNYFVENNNQEKAKELWCYQTICEIHFSYLNAYMCIRNNKFHEGWHYLERCENDLGFLYKHFNISNNEFWLLYIYEYTRKLQDIYPYVWFSSPEMIIGERECSICGQKITFRNPCGHKKGEIYNGELCGYRLKNMELIRLSLVTDPVQKYSVLLTHKDNDEEYYQNVIYLFQNLHSPFDIWDYWILDIYEPHDKYGHIKTNEFCPCGSGEKYEECCLKQKGVKFKQIHFNIIKTIKGLDF